MSDLPEFVLEREFDAPRELVWRVWTDPELLAEWYGPNIETVVHKFDLELGGEWLHEMKMKSGSSFQKIIFQEISKPEKLLWHLHSNTDAEGNDAANPHMPEWPRVLLTSIEFEEKGSGTLVRLSQIPFEATDAEIASFAQMAANMGGGWGQGYTLIDDILAKLQAG